VEEISNEVLPEEILGEETEDKIVEEVVEELPEDVLVDEETVI
jgi:hypothetical protein